MKIYNDDGSFFVESQLFDYAAEGPTLDAALDNFEQGLFKTLKLRKAGTPKNLKVGVFTHPRRGGPRFTAFTSGFSPNWVGCCEHSVFAMNGTEAKKLAIAEHKANCMITPAT